MKNSNNKNGHEQYNIFIPNPEGEDESLKTTKPTHYPCMVLRIGWGVFYSMKIYLIEEEGKDEFPADKVFRKVYLAGVQNIDSYIEQLKNVLMQECKENECNGCLCLNERLCVYYWTENKTFTVSTQVPSTSYWFSDDEFLSAKVLGYSKSNRLRIKYYDFRFRD